MLKELFESFFKNKKFSSVFYIENGLFLLKYLTGTTTKSLLGCRICRCSVSLPKTFGNLWEYLKDTEILCKIIIS